MKPLLLDLFCKAGGASMGYHRAWFEVVGVDIAPQPNYPFFFIQADAIKFLRDEMDYIKRTYSAVTASPPCQKHTQLQSLAKVRNNGKYKADDTIDLIAPTRELLIETGLPYIIENVPKAPLINPITLCGSMFPPLKVYRHRQFESNISLTAPWKTGGVACAGEHHHHDSTPSAGNGTSPKGFISVCGTGGVRGFNKDNPVLDYWKTAMGIDWMNRAELAEAIPPAYTEYLGRQLMEVVGHGHDF